MDVVSDLDGELTIEGPVLECAYSALCVIKGEEVLPRKETLGVTHDLLIRGYKGFIFCEVNGGGEISEDKIRMFREDVLKLNSLLKEEREAPIVEARFVTMLSRTDWGEGAVRLMEETQKDFQGESITLNIVEPKRLIYDLVVSSVLGFTVDDNSILFVGPKGWAIRYDSNISRFMFGGSNMDPSKFRMLPQSFIPLDYWDKRHKELFSSYADLCKESHPEWLDWSPPERFGIKWNSLDQMLVAVERTFSGEGKTVLSEGKEGFVALMKVQRDLYYLINVIHHGQMITGEDAHKINEAFSTLREEFKDIIPEGTKGHPRFRLYVDTVTFSHDFWANLKFVGSIEDPIYPEIFRGEDLLLNALNTGVIGLKLERNHIKLTLEQGPSIMNVVRGSLQWEASKPGTYPATLKF